MTMLPVGCWTSGFVMMFYESKVFSSFHLKCGSAVGDGPCGSGGSTEGSGGGSTGSEGPTNPPSTTSPLFLFLSI